MDAIAGRVTPGGRSRNQDARLAVVFFALSLVFVYRSFYGMRIPVDGQ